MASVVVTSLFRLRNRRLTRNLTKRGGICSTRKRAFSSKTDRGFFSSTRPAVRSTIKIVVESTKHDLKFAANIRPQNASTTTSSSLSSSSDRRIRQRASGTATGRRLSDGETAIDVAGNLFHGVESLIYKKRRDAPRSWNALRLSGLRERLAYKIREDLFLRDGGDDSRVATRLETLHRVDDILRKIAQRLDAFGVVRNVVFRERVE